MIEQRGQNGKIDDTCQTPKVGLLVLLITETHDVFQGSVMTTLEDKAGVLYAVRQVAPEDLPQIHEIIDAEAWSPTLEDVRAMYKPQPQAYMGVFTKSGTLISCCMGYRWGENTAYLAFYVTRESHRGKGIGSALFKMVMTSLGDCNVILDAVSSVGLLYKKIGFQISQTQVTKYHGFVNKGLIPSTPMTPEKFTFTQIKDKKVFEDVVQYDTPIHHGIERRDFLQLWLTTSNAEFLAAYDESGQLVGYGTMRNTARYYRVSPLYASDETIATALFMSLVTGLPDGAKVTCITPGNNRDGICQVMKAVGMEPEEYDFETRMFTKEDLMLPSPKVFAYLNTHNTLM